MTPLSTNQGSIWRVKTTGTNRTQFAPAAIIGSPSGLAFDWMSRIMYYTNPTGKCIEVSPSQSPLRKNTNHYRKYVTF